ncbi:MAG: hypothetical protein Q9209_004762 [Squamulea sp. 1 TL-2023]
MSIRIQLNNAQSLYTNLDFIGGKAILSLTRDEDISAINVKLEGESKSRLEGEPPIPYGYGGMRRRGGEATVVETEVHKVRFPSTEFPNEKILYKAVTVFPTVNLQSARRAGVYTLQPGQHEFPFEFKMQAPGSRDRHVKKTLPPTLHAFQDHAIIRYYIKATVVRPAFYKENFRTEHVFPFFPIEPPRPAPNKLESYARRQHQFAPVLESSVNAKSTTKSPSIFRKGSAPTVGPNASSNPTVAPLHVCIDARLPDPAIITCNEPIPLRVLITKLNDSLASVYLQLLQIELVANTTVRAHHLVRENLTSTVLISKSNMRIRLAEFDKVMEVDNRWWKDISLPNTIAPTFQTCNISRTYFLLVKIGLTHGLGEQTFPELTIHALKISVSVYSGIRPPKALLQAMAKDPTRPQATSIGSSSNAPAHPSSQSSSSASPNVATHPIILNQDPSTPIATGQTHPIISDQHPSAPITTGQTHPEGPFEDEAPPTYQEAIADGIGPVEGTRRDYQHREGGGLGSG